MARFDSAILKYTDCDEDLIPDLFIENLEDPFPGIQFQLNGINVISKLFVFFIIFAFDFVMFFFQRFKCNFILESQDQS